MGRRLAAWWTGARPGLPLTAADIQYWLNRRRPGTEPLRHPAPEPDEVKILSGVFEDDRTGGPVTTGAPISLHDRKRRSARAAIMPRSAISIAPATPTTSMTPNTACAIIAAAGARSARETAARVAAGAVARRSAGRRRADPRRSCADRHDRHRPRALGLGRDGEQSVLVPGRADREAWETLLDETRKDGNSLGAIIEVEATGVPAGWGAPIYGKLDAEIAGALMSINAVKGVEIGAGFAAAALTGVENADEMRAGNGRQAGVSCPTQPAACSAASRPASRSSRASRSSPPPRSSPRARPSTAAARTRKSPPRAATIRASASAPRRWRKRCWRACWRTRSCAIAGRRGVEPRTARLQTRSCTTPPTFHMHLCVVIPGAPAGRTRDPGANTMLVAPGSRIALRASGMTEVQGTKFRIAGVTAAKKRANAEFSGPTQPRSPTPIPAFARRSR